MAGAKKWNAPQWTGKTIRKLSLHKRRTNPFNMGYGLEHLPFLIMYAIVFQYCYESIGAPYAAAIQALEAEGKPICIEGYTGQAENSGLASSALSGGIVREENNALAPGCDAIWEEGEGPRLPNPYLPAILPSLSMLGVTLLHILMLLLQVWSVSVLSFIKYRPAPSLDDATFVKVTPKSYRGKSVLVPIEQHELADGHKTSKFFMFQKRKYFAEIRVEEDDESKTVVFHKLKAPAKQPVHEYVTAQGFTSSRSYLEGLDLYGKNEFSIPQPTFIAMFKQQLLEPLTVFQIFSILLWVLDEYWQYPLFTLCMILMFEGVTVFSRLKNLSTLRGMGNESRKLMAFRFGKWIEVDTFDLVPGDIISVKREKEGETVIPADGILLSGCCVMNEATLTGESVPQMKEAIGAKMNAAELKENLDMKSAHKVHLLFSGTKLMQHELVNVVHEEHNERDNNTVCAFKKIPVSPDKGCTMYVLRTGFMASQGKLVRMIEFSSGKVTSTNYDAIGLAFMLLVFALMSSGYVLKHGIEDKGEVTFSLVLRCVLIITSVIPAELPMQTSLAVNSALLTLVKAAIFCTEPFRIVMAGKVDICLFDKTGTITTDQLTAVGITDYDASKPSSPVDGKANIVPMIEANVEAATVIAGCHSLVQVDGKIIGDPVEEASLRAIDFTFNPSTRVSAPNKSSDKASLRTWKTAANVDCSAVSVQILARNHFTSKLQRMSVVARVNDGKGRTKIRSLVKGSPEAIEQLLAKSNSKLQPKPDWYWKTYKAMAKDGMRVLALAYREVDENMTEHEASAKPRAWAESELVFAGFAAFQCLVRRDSKAVLKTLKDSSHDITMITGDAVLTAIHVARQVNIVTKKALILTVDDENDTCVWKSTEDDDGIEFGMDSQRISELSKEYDLCVSGKSLQKACEQMWSSLECIRVYARMTPELKERVITTLKKHGHHTLMCGDGANDVGALKQADIGVALLSGFGSANVDKAGESGPKTSKTRKSQPSVNNVESRETLMKLHASVLRKKLKALGVEDSTCVEKTELVNKLLDHSQKKQVLDKQRRAKKNPNAPLTKAEKEEKMRKMQEDIERDVAEREARGESFARIKATMAIAQRQAAEAKANAQKNRGFAARTNNAIMNQYMDDFEDGDVPMVKLGDASIASPFTSRAPSIKATVDIIRQGRCALVTTMQMYQILAVNCLISAYSLSVLYLDEIKYANNQMIALGIISTVASLSLSRATPLKKLSPVRPLNSIFHPALFVSLFGQFVIHLICMIYSTNLAKQYTEDNDDRHVASGEFQPNVMSTVVFLVNSVQTVSVCFVNYKGRPFMVGMADNPGLLYTLGCALIGVFLCATEAMPMFNKLIEIVPMPSPAFTQMLLITLVIDVFGAFVWDQLCMMFFAPQIFKASINATSSKDVRKFIKMAIISFGIIYIFSNIDYEEIERQQRAMELAEQAKAEREAASADIF